MVFLPFQRSAQNGDKGRKLDWLRWNEAEALPAPQGAAFMLWSTALAAQ